MKRPLLPLLLPQCPLSHSPCHAPPSHSPSHLCTSVPMTNDVSLNKLISAVRLHMERCVDASAAASLIAACQFAGSCRLTVATATGTATMAPTATLAAGTGPPLNMRLHTHTPINTHTVKTMQLYGKSFNLNETRRSAAIPNSISCNCCNNERFVIQQRHTHTHTYTQVSTLCTGMKFPVQLCKVLGIVLISDFYFTVDFCILKYHIQGIYIP